MPNLTIEPVYVACGWKKHAELPAAVNDAFDVHLCVALKVGQKAPKFQHFRHRLHPDRFRSPSNDVSGVMGLLGGMESESRSAGFERAIGDLLQIFAAEGIAELAPSECSPPILVLRGPLFPKLRGRLLMSAATRETRIYVVTSEMVWLRCMDLQGSLELASPEELLNRMDEGDLSRIIPPTGLDKGTRCWLAKHQGRLVHFELISNMEGGILDSEWLSTNETIIRELLRSSETDSLAAQIDDRITGYYAPPVSGPERGIAPRPSTTASPNVALDRPDDLVPAEANRVFSAYRPFFSRKGWAEFNAFVTRDYWPQVLHDGLEPAVIKALPHYLPQQPAGFDPLQNRIRPELAQRTLLRLLQRLQSARP